VSRAALLLLGALALGACGKVGPPAPPAPDSFPKQYPQAEVLRETGNSPPPSPTTNRQPANPYAPIQPGDTATQ
jgi:hypothetical protein